MAGGRVVRAGDGKCREDGVVAQLAHPGVQVGGGEDGQVGFGSHPDTGEAVLGVLDGLHGCGLAGGNGHLDVMLFALGAEVEAQALLVGFLEGIDFGALGGEGLNADAEVFLFREGFGILGEGGGGLFRASLVGQHSSEVFGQGCDVVHARLVLRGPEALQAFQVDGSVGVVADCDLFGYHGGFEG